jgi:transcriptional regulator with XRE-family HTH domain
MWRDGGGLLAWCRHPGATIIVHMNKTRIVQLREEHGWTQERLASASGVGLRTIQRLEAGQDASLETLSLVAEALRVSVRDLFSSIDDELNDRVESLQARTEEQQTARDTVARAWRWLYIGIGIVLTLVSVTLGSSGFVLFLAYWTGGYVILVSIRTIYLDPRLDEKYPLSRSRRYLRSERKSGHAVPRATSVDNADAPSPDRLVH